jgi:GGDEF domain-containing protein
LFADIDDFKRVMTPHAGEDEVLLQFAQRIRQRETHRRRRRGARAFRGDEFVILVEPDALGGRDAREVASRLAETPERTGR